MKPHNLGEENSESFGIKKFVRWVLRQPKFKAKRYGLILSGHSDGIIGRTLLRDENPPISLDIRKLRKILTKAKAYLGHQQKFDLLGFDGCLMGMLEVSYELKDIAKILVGSQGNIPNSGWNYQDIFKDLIINPQVPTEKFASDIVCNFSKYNRDYIVSGRSVDATAINLEKIEELGSMIDLLAKLFLLILDFQSLETDLNDDTKDKNKEEKAFLVSLFINLLLLAHYHSQTYMHEQAVDIWDFIENIWSEINIKLYETVNILPKILFKNSEQIVFQDFIGILINQNQSDSKLKPAFESGSNNSPSLEDLFTEFEKLNNFQTALESYIIKHCFVGAEYQFSKGVSIFFPWTEIALDLVYKRYSKLRFNQRFPNWLKFIEKYTQMTLRSNKTRKSVSFDLDYLGISDSQREHGGREHGGREHGGRGELESFYRFFNQVRNYSIERVPDNPNEPNDYNLWNCGNCDKT